MNFCLNCGNKLPIPNCHFCPFCGFDLRPYISKVEDSQVSSATTVKAPRVENHVADETVHKAEKAEASSTDLGEEVKNLKQNLGTPDTTQTQSQLDDAVKEVSNADAQQQSVPAQASDNETADEKLADLHQVKKPTRSRKPIKDVSMPDNDEVADDNASESPEQPAGASADVTDEATDDVVTTPDPEIDDPATPDSDDAPSSSEENRVIVTPEAVDLDSESDNDDDENFGDVDDVNNVDNADDIGTEDEVSENDDADVEDDSSEDADSSTNQPSQPQAIEENDPKPTNDNETVDTKPAVELPNTLEKSDNHDLGDDYADQDSSNDHDSDNHDDEQSTHSKDTDATKEQDVAEASRLLSNLAKDAHNKDHQKQNVKTDDDSTNDDDDVTSVADVANDSDAPTELPDEYAPKSSETTPDKPAKMQPDTDVRDSVYREKQPKHHKLHRPFEQTRAKSPSKHSSKKQERSSRKSMNFGFGQIK